jgi:hypothetical protein
VRNFQVFAVTLFMNSFRTDVSARVSEHTFDIKNNIFTIGSCFADAIGSRLAKYKWQVSVNPFGAIYNPVSIHKLIEILIDRQSVPDNSYVQSQDVHSNFFFHSKMSSVSRDGLRQMLESGINTGHGQLKRCDRLIVTYGTAFVHTRNDTGEIVANCHKLSSSFFTKNLLFVEDVTTSFDTMFTKLKAINPALRIILTVSPVRHTKDTLELNNVSKSILRVACHEIAKRHSDVEYFPAYEIMMDDLRDYRFYKPDMIHPTQQAEDYIFEKFADAYINSSSQRFIKTWDEILSALAHKPFNPTAPKHQEFVKKLLKKLDEIAEVDVTSEKEEIKKQLL